MQSTVNRLWSFKQVTVSQPDQVVKTGFGSESASILNMVKNDGGKPWWKNIVRLSLTPKTQDPGPRPVTNISSVRLSHWHRLARRFRAKDSKVARRSRRNAWLSPKLIQTGDNMGHKGPFHGLVSLSRSNELGHILILNYTLQQTNVEQTWQPDPPFENTLLYKKKKSNTIELRMYPKDLNMCDETFISCGFWSQSSGVAPKLSAIPHLWAPLVPVRIPKYSSPKMVQWPLTNPNVTSTAKGWKGIDWKDDLHLISQGSVYFKLTWTPPSHLLLFLQMAKQ